MTSAGAAAPRTVIVAGVLLFLLGGFFRSQVLKHAEVRAAVGDQPAARDSAAGAARRDLRPQRQGHRRQRRSATRCRCSRRTKTRCARCCSGSPARSTSRRKQFEQAVRRFRRAPSASDGDHPGCVVRRRQRARGASHAVSRADHPERAAALLSRRAGRRAVRRLHGRNQRGGAGADATFADYKAGQQVGKQGLEKQYESMLRGKEGSQFVEVDARGRIVRQAGARAGPRAREAAKPLYTNIDLDLQRVHRRHLRRLAAGRRGGDRSARRAKCSRCTARRAGTPTASSAAFPRSTRIRCATIRVGRSTTRRCRDSIRRARRSSSPPRSIGLETGTRAR